MSLSLILSLAIKKIKFRKARSLLLALPILLLTIIVATVSSWAGSLEHKVASDIINAVERAKYVVEIMNQSSSSQPSPEHKGVLRTPINSNELKAKIKQVDGVVALDERKTIRTFANVDIEGLENHDFYLNGLSSLSSEMIDLYNVTEFNYQPGQPIPVIAGPSLLQEIHYNFNGKTTAEEPINFNPSPESDQKRVVEHSSNRDLLNSQLVGKTGQMSFTFLPQNPAIMSGQEGMTRTYSKLTAAQQAEYQDRYRSALQQYWDLNRLSKPIEYKFIIVGVNNSGDYSTFVPLEALASIQQNMYLAQLQARNSTPIPADTLQEKIIGNLLNKEGVYPNALYSSHQVNEQTWQNPQLQLPGLLVKPIKDDKGNLRFVEVSNYDFTEDSLAGGYLFARINDFDKRQKIVEDIMNLDKNGRLYAGMSDVDGYSQLLELMSKALLIASAILSLIVAIIVLILAWGFASDANREVGLLRALGITANNAWQVVLWQLIVIFSISLLIGSALSIVVLYGGANWIADWLNTTYFSNTQAAYADRNVLMQASEMQIINLRYVMPYLIATMALPILAAFLATRRNLKTDPLQALKM